mmetsp:Transcript_78874/g.207060  ORF Transcript_78874/g.207060 Transcript_78874/m.207060 type:complete len:889 (-) Transcript_78874:66-2732(-)
MYIGRLALAAGLVAAQVVLVLYFLYAAYDIRLYPIKDFGYIIHEFDPWFNYRAAEYLAEQVEQDGFFAGLGKFFKWYDYESWYPLGRPIGTTIYPGMQMTAVAMREGMKKVSEFDLPLPAALLSLNPAFATLRKMGWMFVPKIPKVLHYAPMSVNDICCMIPPWFGSIASLFTGLLTYEVSRSVNSAVMATGIMAVIPAHLMRSVGGEFDNEAVAVSAICATFWLWCLSVRTPRHWPIGVLVGISYAYMVAAWGGYIFVLNMIGLHVCMLVALGRFNTGVHRAYSLFFIIGTIGAVQIPVVGWQPLRSLEQIGPLLVFFGLHVLEFCDMQRRRRKMGDAEFVKFRIQMVMLFLGALVAVTVCLWPTGYFGPLSSRIRGLFVKHTKTGNPLVDSVAEHQPANPSMYASYLNLPLDYAIYGGLVCLGKRNNGFYFLVLYGFIAQHFSGKMSRLVLICGPIVAVACGIWCGFILDFLLEPFLHLLGKKGFEDAGAPEVEKKAPESDKAAKDKGGKDKGKDKEKEKPKPAAKKPKSKHAVEDRQLEEWEAEGRPGGAGQAKRLVRRVVLDAFGEETAESVRQFRVQWDGTMFLLGRAVFSAVALFYILFLSSVPRQVGTFVKHCDSVAKSLSNPQVVYQVRGRDGKMMLIDDYLKGYQWIEKNTPKEARVMAWWDYGYQITGIAKRTSIADGNTWNHEHIATLGRTLTSPEKKAHNVIRHLADYVLVWAGGGGDDLAKSPHLARIGNSVFPDHCGDDDPKCNKFGFHADRSPTPMMAQSLLYKAVMHNMAKGVKLDGRLFQEVHTTKHGLMRVYKVMNISEESRDWVANPKNRICDAPGSWYCVGQYPPALEKLIAKRRNFAQVEDFNKAGQEKSAYSKMIDKESGRSSAEL